MRGLALTAVSIGITALTACSASGSSPAASAGDAAVPDTGAAGPDAEASGPCDLTQQPFTFDALSDGGRPLHGPCDECLQTSCCGATVSCFAQNPDCTAITPCVNQCNLDCPPGTGTGMGGGDGGGGGHGDGGGNGRCPYRGTTEVGDAGITVQVDPYDQCVQACYGAHPASMATYQAFSSCYLDTCKAVCRP